MTGRVRDSGRLTHPTSVLFELILIVGALFNLVVGALTLLTPAAFLSAVGQPAQDLTSSALVFGAYAGARELALGLALLGLRVTRQPAMLSGVLLLAGLSNAIDAGGALVAQRWVQLPGAAAFTVAYVLAAMWLSRWADSGCRNRFDPC